MSRVVLMQGNQACAEAALAAGVRFFAGYPITPSTEVAEIFAARLPLLGGKFIQMEDEIAGMGAVCGASLAGVKALTATSGPGFSLKQELIGYAAMAEIPVVVVNVQRLGPSTGKPTAPAQGDVMQARWGTHGDRAAIALSPTSVRETYDVTVHAINFSEKFRLPVIILLDEIIGHMREKIALPDPSTLRIIERKKPDVPSGEYLAYRPDDDGVAPLAAFGDGYHYHVTGLVHDETGFPAGSASITADLITRLHTKVYNAKSEITLFDEYFMEDAETAVVAYGGTFRSAMAAVKEARAKGNKVGLIKLITIWPFADEVVARAAAKVGTMIVPELNYGQLVGEVHRAANGRARIVSLPKVDGGVFTPQEILSVLDKEVG
ncbi:MAG TPA: 2-oxoacid:acceptor oxidoreductase subunit alpha [Firmicutes bacterium]|nr:2-oxoacid:acceptor oxidoreductase subunit alpha [Bacillota bacterium]